MAGSSSSTHLLEIQTDAEWDAYVDLKQALRTGDAEKAKLLINSGVKVNFDSEDYTCTPLHLAVGLGCLDVVKLLVEKGAPVNFLNVNKESPIVVAVKTGKFDIVDYLLSVIDLEAFSKYPQKEDLTLLHIACMRDKINIVKRLVESGESINTATHSRSLYWPGYTPLHITVQYRCYEIVHFLLTCGADLTIKNKKKLTPLHLAFMMDDEKLVDLILSYHKYEFVNPVNSEGLSHFHIACSRNNPDVVRSFINYGVDVNMEVSENFLDWNSFRPIDFAIYNECTDVIKLLLSCNVKLKHRHFESICTAYGTKNKKLIDLILSRQQNERTIDTTASILDHKNYASFVEFIQLNVFDQTGYTPLHAAVKLKNLSMAELILQKSSSLWIEAKDARGKTPLHLAFESNLTMAVALILDYYNNISENSVNDDGLLHFHIACTTSTDLKVITSFLEMRVDINSPVPMTSKIYPGYTPLHFASEFGQNDVYKFLLEHGADITIKNKAELTAFDIAVSKFGLEMDEDNVISIIESTLVKAGNDKIDFFDDRGFSLLHLYCMRYKLDKIKKFLNFYPQAINKRINWPRSLYFEDSPLNFLMFSDIDKNDIKLFMRKGADIYFKNAKQEAILYKLLKYCPQLDNKKSLILSADKNYVDPDGKSYFHLACTQGDIEIIRHFIDQKVDVNKRRELVCPSYTYDTPLHLIASSSTYTWFKHKTYKEYAKTLLKLLLDEDADIDARDGRLNTPLYVASKANNVEIIEILLSNGADVNAINLYYETPLHIVCKNFAGNDKLLRTFFNYGADINIENEDGETPFSLYVKEFGNNANVHEIVVMMKHLRKLELINYFVSMKNKTAYKKMLPKFQGSPYYKEIDFVEESNRELEQLKIIYIDNYTSLYDLLFKSHNQMTFHIKNYRLKNILNYNGFYCTFPSFSYLIKYQFKQGVIRRPLLNECKDVFQDLTLCLLPELCVDHILQHLSNKDLQNIIWIKIK